MTPLQAEALVDAWRILEETNAYARNFVAIADAMAEVNDPDNYVRGVEALTSGLAHQHRDLLELITVTGRTIEATAPEVVERLSTDPLAWLAGPDPLPDDAD